MYIYTCDFLATIALALLKQMWFDRILAGGALVRDLSLSLACPFHCQGSILLPLLCGFASGSLFGFLLASALGLYLIRAWTFTSATSATPSPSSSAAHLRRLSAYVG